MSERGAMPPRPDIPLLAYALIAFIACARWALGEAVGVDMGLRSGSACAAAGAALLFAANRSPKELARRLASSCSIALVSAAAALLLGGISSEGASRCAEALGSSAASAWELTLEGDMSQTATGWRGKARAVYGDGPEQGIVWLTSSEQVERGTTLRCVGRFKPLANDEWGRSSRMQGVCGTVRAVRVLESRGPEDALLALRRRLIAGLGADSEDSGEARAVAAGAVCGYAAPMRSMGLDELFAACGVSHLVAVSGSHLSLLTAGLASLLARAGASPRGRAASTLALGMGFVLMCGAPASAIRAWVMSAASLGAQLVGRRGHALSALCAAALAMAALDPTVCGQMGYLLSILCVGGLCVFGGYAKHLLGSCLVEPVGGFPFPARARRRLLGALRPASDSMALALVCSLASAPVAVPAFGRVSLVGPLCSGAASALFAPFMAVGGLAAVTAPVPLVHEALLRLLDAIGWALLGVLRLFASVPGSYPAVDADGGAMLCALAAGALALYIAWPEPSPKAMAAVCSALACAAIAWHVRWRFFAPARVCVMDVGQADSILVTDGASAILVDAGLDARAAQALARNNVSHLDAVVLTHLDEDHVGGLDDLLGAVTCDDVIVAEGVGQSIGTILAQSIERLCGHAAREVSYGDELRFGSFAARVVWPREPVSGQSNAESLELLLAFDDGKRTMTALLTGDGEKDETGAVASSGDVGDIDLLKVGHHGSAASIDEGLARELAPEVAVASAGEGNSYGHPRAECVEALEEAGALFLCTKDVGDVTVEPAASGVRVRCARAPDG